MAASGSAAAAGPGVARSAQQQRERVWPGARGGQHGARPLSSTCHRPPSHQHSLIPTINYSLLRSQPPPKSQQKNQPPANTPFIYLPTYLSFIYPSKLQRQREREREIKGKVGGQSTSNNRDQTFYFYF